MKSFQKRYFLLFSLMSLSFYLLFYPEPLQAISKQDKMGVSQEAKKAAPKRNPSKESEQPLSHNLEQALYGVSPEEIVLHDEKLSSELTRNVSSVSGIALGKTLRDQLRSSSNRTRIDYNSPILFDWGNTCYYSQSFRHCY